MYVVPSSVIDRLSPPPSVAVPVMAGVESFVVWEATVGAAGAVVSITSSSVVVSAPDAPPLWVTAAVTG